MVSELIQKYIWLIQTIVKSEEKGLTFKEIERKWESRFGSEYPRRTFNNHREAIAEVFGIEILCNRSRQVYYIQYSEDVTDADSENAWLINTFTVNNLLEMGKERLSGRISIEDIPSGQKYLTRIMDAMLDNQEIEITYQKYSVEEHEVYTLRPYALKEYSKRWYLVGYCVERSGLRIYGLDRITSIQNTGNLFDLPENFDVDALFATSFGIYISDTKPCEIIFRAFRHEAKYLMDLPLHKSQEVVSIDKDSTTFSVYASPDVDMIMALLQRGDRIEVLSPEFMRQRMADEIKKMAALYPFL